MGNWGFIGLAYGVAAAGLVAYVVSLRKRLGQVREELTALEREP